MSQLCLWTKNPRQTETRFECLGFSMRVFCAPNARMLACIPACIRTRQDQNELCMASYQGLFAKFVSMMCPKCSIVENWVGAARPLSATAALYSDVRTFFGLSMRMPVSFTFSQDNEHTEVTVLLFFKNQYPMFAHVLQYYHDFQNNITLL